jgi:hypothetical protein
MSDAHQVRGGSCFFCEAAWGGISQTLNLSKRDVEIVQCLVLGDTERQIAEFLGRVPARSGRIWNACVGNSVSTRGPS